MPLLNPAKAFEQDRSARKQNRLLSGFGVGHLSLMVTLTACTFRPVEALDASPPGAQPDAGAIPSSDAETPTTAVIGVEGLDLQGRLAWKSGTRLKPRTVATPEGEKLVLGWFDQQRNGDCQFLRLTENVWACAGLESTRFQSTGEFADAACTQPALRLSGTIPVHNTQVVAALRSPSCSSHYQLFELGPMVPASSTYAIFDGKCSRAAAPTNVVLFQRGSQLTDTPFVTLSVHVGRATGGLAPVHLKGDDGSLVPLGFQDVKHNVRCTFRLAPDGETRCLPDTVFTSGGDFSDAMCTSRLVALDAANECDVDRPFINQTVLGTCPAQVEVYRNAGLTPKSYGMGTGACTENTRAIFKRLALGPNVPLTDFVAAEITTVTSSAQVRLWEAMTPAGSLRLHLYDTKHKEICRLGKGVDGTDRCLLGSAPFAKDAFADAACSKPAVWASGDCDAKFINLDGRIYRKGAAVQDAYTKDEMGVCKPRVTGGRAYVEIGEEIPVATLVPLRVELEN
jgi:hypothetical protein